MNAKTKELCQNKDHDNQEIIAVCTFFSCQEPSRKCCAKCLLKLHKNHKDQVTDLEDLNTIKENMLSTIPTNIIQFQNKLNSQVEEIKKFVELIETNFYSYDTQFMLKNHEQISKQLMDTFTMITKAMELIIIQVKTGKDAEIQQLQKNATKLNEEANVLHNSGKYNKALELYQKAISIYPHNEVYWSNKGSSLGSLGRYAESIECHEIALTYKPDHSFALREKAFSLNGLKNYQEALVSVEQALAIDPNDGAAWNNKGNALYGLHEYKEALIAYEKSLQCGEMAVRFHNKANTLEKLGRIEECKEFHKLAIKKDKNYQLSKDALKRLGVSDIS